MTRFLVPILAIVALAAALPARALADDDVITSPDRREANALYKEGVRLYDGGDYAGALQLFETAFARYPAPRVEFSVATTLKQMGRTVEAANWYQRFVDDPGAEPQLVSEARTLLTLLDTMVGRVDISTGAAVGEIQLGDGPWIEARGAIVLRVAPGTVVVRGRRAGFVAEATVKVAAGGAEPVELRWAAARAPSHDARATDAHATDAPIRALAAPNATPGARAEPSRSRSRKLAAIASAGGGVLLAGAGLALELSARGRIADAAAICPDFRCDGDALIQARALTDSASTRRYGGLAADGAAAIAIAAGVALWWTAPRDADVQVAPVATDHTVGLVVAGRF
ncbi:MAG TPA: hypothetical protein VL463_05715 [Kofleriaceae bacterium]|nr:hypothetical protein [Kofleriaceae bacterium]